MNEKFYHLPQERQLLIINAAYKVFARNSYMSLFSMNAYYENEPEIHEAFRSAICFGGHDEPMVSHRKPRY